MTNLEYRNAVYKILGKEPIEADSKPVSKVDLKKELRKQKQLKDHYLAKYKEIYNQNQNREN